MYLLNIENYQSLRITDIQGTVQLAKELNGLATQSIDLPELSNGLFLIQLFGQGVKSVTLKLQVNR
ncbi:MAG: hypothetical protein GC205_01210 [Bacteroidetes bacterium]|nr:hypothetical protein [Bacteroidota bacterium]